MVRRLSGEQRERSGGGSLAVGLHERAGYAAKVREIQRLIGEGETYEACLTTTLEATPTGGPPDTLELYHRLRRDNPAPFGAYLRLPGATVMSTSPERFLSVDVEGRITSSPIKEPDRSGKRRKSMRVSVLNSGPARKTVRRTS